MGINESVYNSIKYTLQVAGGIEKTLGINGYVNRYRKNDWNHRGIEWFYGLRNAKLCVLHNTQSGPPSRHRAPCVLVALPATSKNMSELRAGESMVFYV